MQADFNPALTKEEVLRCPLCRYDGKTVLVQTDEELESALEELSGASFLGFDTETRPTFKKGEAYPPSLVQLASEEAVYLFRLQKISLDKLLALLAREDVLKAGVAVDNDIRALRCLGDFQPAGMVDLGKLAARHNIAQHSLRGLAACFLGVRIYKSMRCSNWSQARLTSKQISYAATDAWIGLRIYLQFRKFGLV